jgi:hypothetical protein
MLIKVSNKFQESIRNNSPGGTQPDHISQACPSNPSKTIFEALESQDEEKEGSVEEDSRKNSP